MSRARAVFILVFIGASVMLTTCYRQGATERELTPAEQDLKLSGIRLSEKYCTNCHLLPEPELLTPSSWQEVLYKMREEMTKASVAIIEVEWDTLNSYYQTFSNDLLAVTKRKIKEPASLFEKNDTVLDLPSSTGASITLLKFERHDASVFFGDVRKQLYRLRKNKPLDTFFIQNVPVAIRVDTLRNIARVLCIGSLAPSEKANGQLLQVDFHSKLSTVILDSLKRPVHFVETDLDNDGEIEYLISSFGSTVGQVNSGRLSLFKKDGDRYREQVLMELPGATKARVDDYNNDGRPDVFALFSQGSERIVQFTNDGSLKFTKKVLLEFPSVYGVSDFILQDMDADGRKDIIVANGDNGDYSPIYKPYHGLRIYKQHANGQFIQSYFLEINGAMRFVVGDFDLDHDPDIVVLSIYPNLFYTPEEKLVFLENKGDDFTPYYLEQKPSAKWLVLDAGDIDQDGDLDIITGANNMLTFPIPEEYTQRFQSLKKPVAVFLNTTR